MFARSATVPPVATRCVCVASFGAGASHYFIIIDTFGSWKFWRKQVLGEQWHFLCSVFIDCRLFAFVGRAIVRSFWPEIHQNPVSIFAVKCVAFTLFIFGFDHPFVVDITSGPFQKQNHFK